MDVIWQKTDCDQDEALSSMWFLINDLQVELQDGVHESAGVAYVHKLCNLR